MIKRYSRPEMARIWDPESKFRNFAIVEAAVLEARRNLGMLDVPVPPFMELAMSLIIDLAEIERIEKETRHDVIAFLMHTNPQLPPELRPEWHRKLTSYDTQDTAFSLMLRESVELLVKVLGDLMEAIKVRAFEYKTTPQIGRTHIVHAEPITFGVKLANWYDEFARHRVRLMRLKDLVSVIKLSGAVGMYSLSPEVEEETGRLLGLRPMITTQIISRDIIAEYLATLANIAGTIEKICVANRLMQQTEVLEVQEYFAPRQRGSSAMPHKRNPILDENLTGLARVVRNNAGVGFENQATWHERDISNSSAERIVLVDSSILLNFMIVRLTGIIRKLNVYPERMMRNLELTKGLIFSQDVQSLLAEKSSLPREEAYELVYNIAQQCIETREDFQQALLASPEVMAHVTKEELAACFDLSAKLKHIVYIFEQVFGKEA